MAGLFVKKGMRIITLSIFTLIPVFSPMDIRADDTSPPLILEHADQLSGAGGNSDIWNLLGNVHLSHEGTHIYSHRATWYRKTGLVQFIDSVRVVDTDKTINARRVTYFRREKRAIAEGNVRIEDTARDMLLLCGKADYFRQSRQFQAMDDPVLFLNVSDDSSKMKIQSKRMEYFADQARGTAYDSVVIRKSNMTATGGRADFQRDPEVAILYNDPVVIQGENRLAGDTISIFTRERAIERLLVEGNAKAFYQNQPDTLLSEFTTAEITGKELEVFFKGDEIDRAITRRNAISVYVPAVTDTLTRGTNVASGDSIILYFDRGSIQRVLISGGAEGKYIEPNIGAEEKIVYDTTKYSARQIDYDFSLSKISLLNNGMLEYQDMLLNAGDIEYDLNEKILSARGIKDDSTDDVWEEPVLQQGADKLYGSRMTYNLDTEKGQVSTARTKYEGGFYYGKAIRQISEDEMFVSQGNYSSCDQEEDTHYHFQSRRMKMISKDKVVAKPVILVIGELPVFAVPYYVFPIKKGRHSGFLPFEIGNFERGERFIRNVGYYWAASEYWDLETGFDYYESRRIILNTGLRYNLLYHFNGGLRFNYARETSWVNYKHVVEPSWRLDMNHHQDVSQTIVLTASGGFVSDKSFTTKNVYDLEERLNRTVRSDISINKKWPSSASSLVISGGHTWNLDTDVREERLPKFTFSRSAWQLFPASSGSKKNKRLKPWEEPVEPKTRFYNTLSLNISTSGQNINNHIMAADSSFYWRGYQTLLSQADLSAPQNIFGVLTLTPDADFTHTLYHLNWNTEIEKDTLANLRTDRLFTRETYSLGLSARTDLYGMVYPNILGLTALRHVATPSITYRFKPDILNNEKYRDYTGIGNSSRRSKTLSYSLKNVFQAKYRSGETEKKTNLFNMDISGAYDFVPEIKKIKDVTVYMRADAIPIINLTYNSQYSFYNFDDSRRPLNNPRLVNSTIASSFRGSFKPGKTSEKGEDELEDESRKTDEIWAKGKAGGKGVNISEIGIEYSVSHNYTITKSASGTIKSQWFKFGLILTPTVGWGVEYDCNYDMESDRINSQGLNIKRDMHCWEGYLTWIPSGPVAGYYVRINIKSLPDIKIEKSEGGVGGRSFR